jgi:glycine cleavage system H protein
MKIASYGVFGTPAVIIDEDVRSVGRIPKKEEILKWVKTESKPNLAHISTHFNKDDFLEAKGGNFVFKVKIGYFYSKDDFWASVDDKLASVGVSDFLQKQKGDVLFLETVEAGTEVKQGQELGKIEAIKATFGILSPVSGKVVEVNAELEASSYLINEDPYGAGWIYKIELEDFESDKKELLQELAYVELSKEKSAEVTTNC